MKLEQMNRYQAFGSHLLISLVIFAVILICITQYWYPGFLFDTGNGLKAIGLIVGIDLVLGPLLTLLVFNPQKSSLKFDLSIIAAVQIAALTYGTWTIYSTHPVALAFVNNHFVTLYNNAELTKEIKPLIEKLGTNQLFYDFDAVPQSQGLNPDGFKPYQPHASTIINMTSPYFIKIDGTTYVNIDPLAGAKRFLVLDDAGNIQSLASQLPNNQPTEN